MMKSHDDRSLLHYPFLINQLSVSRQQTNLKGVVLSSCRNFLRYAMPWNSGAFMDEYSSLLTICIYIPASEMDITEWL